MHSCVLFFLSIILYSIFVLSRKFLFIYQTGLIRAWVKLAAEGKGIIGHVLCVCLVGVHILQLPYSEAKCDDINLYITLGHSGGSWPQPGARSIGALLGNPRWEKRLLSFLEKTNIGKMGPDKIDDEIR
jgi:hypothetical protein